MQSPGKVKTSSGHAYGRCVTPKQYKEMEGTGPASTRAEQSVAAKVVHFASESKRKLSLIQICFFYFDCEKCMARNLHRFARILTVLLRQICTGGVEICRL
jgi:hypothetical protein